MTSASSGSAMVDCCVRRSKFMVLGKFQVSALLESGNGFLLESHGLLYYGDVLLL